MDRKVFQSRQAQEMIDYIHESYGDELEFLWPKFSENAIVRNERNRKWYAAFLRVSGAKLGLDDAKVIDILDLRFDKHQAREFVASAKHVYPGYHMNKDNWITVILDGGLSNEQVAGLIDKSYEIADRKK